MTFVETLATVSAYSRYGRCTEFLNVGRLATKAEDPANGNLADYTLSNRSGMTNNPRLLISHESGTEHLTRERAWSIRGGLA